MELPMKISKKFIITVSSFLIISIFYSCKKGNKEPTVIETELQAPEVKKEHETENPESDTSDKLNQYENDDSETDEKYDYTEKVLALYEEFYSKYLPDGYYHGQEIPISIFNEWKKDFEFTGWTERKEEGKFGEFVWKFQHYKNDYCEIQFSDESDEIVAWEGTIMTKTIPNSLGIEIGMTKNQVEEIIGLPFSNIYNEYDDGYRYVRFNFNNEVLESIQVFYNSMAGY